MNRFGGHLSNLPPGSVVWYGALNALLDQVPQVAELGRQLLMPFQCQNYDLLAYTPGQWASTIFGMAMPVWAALTPIPLYALARRVLVVDVRPAVLWYPLIPGLAGFAGTWNTWYPFLALLALLTFMIGCQPRSRFALWCYLSGLICSIALFINFAFIPLPLFLGIWLLVSEVVVKRRLLLDVILRGVAYLIGLATVWVIFWLASGQTPFDLLGTALSFHLSLDRPYVFWFFMNPWDWLLWGGLGLGILTFFNLARWLASRPRDLSRLPVLTMTLALTMFILVISGTARSETGRVWLFFTPFLLITALESRLVPQEPLRRSTWLWIAVPQAVLVIALVSSIPSEGTDFRPPLPPPQVAVSHSVNALFTNEAEAGRFRLIGWDGDIRNNVLELRLNWEGVEPSTMPIWFGAVLVGSDGETVPVTAWQPGGETRFPTTCWRAGVVVGDTIDVPLSADASGEWWVSLAAFGDPSQPEGRLTVQLEKGTAADTQIGLGPISAG